MNPLQNNYSVVGSKPIDSNNTEKDSGLSIGFIGCGTIAVAIATGIAKQEQIPIKRISVSRRSKAKSQELQERFPNLVTIHDDMQELVDRSTDMVFLCVLPEKVEQVLQDVTFSEESQQKLVSIVASANLKDLAKLSSLPLHRVAKMICTPSIAQHEGVCLLHSLPQPVKEQSNCLPKLLDALGGCIQCDTVEKMNILMSGMCVMGPLYGLLQTHVQWMKSKGISEQDANVLVTRQYNAILKDAAIYEPNDGDRIAELIAEQTKDGINEQALDNWRRMGSLESYTSVLDAIVGRLEGTTDGTL